MTVARLILAIVAFALALAVIKLATLALIVAGLIFRPTTTIGLLALLGLLALVRAQPAIGIGAVAVFVVAAIAIKVKEAKA